MLFMFGFDLTSSFWISIAGRSPTCLPSRLINTVLSAVIFGEGNGAKLISPSARRPLREISESIVDCMSVVREKPRCFKSRIPVRKQSSFVCAISKMSSCVGFGSVLSLSRSVSLKAASHDSQMLVTANYSQQMTEVISSTSSFDQLN